MDRRRNGLIALVVLVTAVAALVYYETREPGEPTTAFAPAQSADESVAPSDTPIVPPEDLAAAPSQSAETEAAVAAPPVDDMAEDMAEGPGEPEAPVETDVAMVDPAGDEPSATADTTAPPVVDTEMPPVAVPTFDIVRVEPSGDTVIAGQAEPNATVEIMDGPSVIATAEANDAGEWVIALEAPLDPGSHDLAISTTTADEAFVTLSDERVTVSVPDDGSGDVLVVLNAPDAPSTVLQVPPAAMAEAEQQVAAAEDEPAAESDVATAEQPAEQDIALADTEAAPAAAVEDSGSAAATTVESVPDAAGEPTVTTEALPTPDEADVAATSEPAVVEDTPPATAMGEGASDTAATTTAEPDMNATADEGPAATTEQQVAMAPLAEDATDSAAAVAPLAGEPEVAVEEPVTVEPPIAAESPAEQEAEVAMTPPVADEPPAPLPPPEPMVTVAAVEADTSGALYVAGVAATGEAVRVYIDDEYIDDALPSPSGTWLVETVMDLPAGQYVVRVDQVDADGSVIARYEVPFDREVEVAILKPTGMTASADGATLAGAMPDVDTVIIKRGDNLWRIARSTWGKGIRWSTIYQANTDQIRNPHRIYPGQVFVMPKGDAAWQN